MCRSLVVYPRLPLCIGLSLFSLPLPLLCVTPCLFPTSLARACLYLAERTSVHIFPRLLRPVPHISLRGCSGMCSRLPLQRVLPLEGRAPWLSPFRRRMQLHCGPSSRSGSRAGSTPRRTIRVSLQTPDAALHPPPTQRHTHAQNRLRLCFRLPYA